MIYNDEQREYFHKWDPTHEIVQTAEFWNDFLMEAGYCGDVNFKSLF